MQSWNSSTLATSCEELTHWKRLWCWEGLGAGGEGDDRGWDGWMASPTWWTWVWMNSGSWWWTGRPGMLQFMGLQRFGHDWATELKTHHSHRIRPFLRICLFLILVPPLMSHVSQGCFPVSVAFNAFGYKMIVRLANPSRLFYCKIVWTCGLLQTQKGFPSSKNTSGHKGFRFWQALRPITSTKNFTAVFNCP